MSLMGGAYVANAIKEYEETLVSMGFTIDKKVHSFFVSQGKGNIVYTSILYSDIQKKSWSFLKVDSTLKKTEKLPVKIYNNFDIIRFEMTYDGIPIASGYAGEMLQGMKDISQSKALIYDEDGKIRTIVHSPKLIIKVKDSEAPAIIIEFFDVPMAVKFAKKFYKNKVDEAEKMLSILVDIMRMQIPDNPVNEMPKKSNKRITAVQNWEDTGQEITESMRRINKLKRDGVISEEEYDMKMKELYKRL
jgi:hypothetical protein